MHNQNNQHIISIIDLYTIIMAEILFKSLVVFYTICILLVSIKQVSIDE